MKATFEVHLLQFESTALEKEISILGLYICHM